MPLHSQNSLFVTFKMFIEYENRFDVVNEHFGLILQLEEYLRLWMLMSKERLTRKLIW